ncbi:MAG: hypothetical protein HKL96_08340 [Phycisphaerales bacterium]|nr:hypothetical protein [Phycisphaerales bacterium]
MSQQHSTISSTNATAWLHGWAGKAISTQEPRQPLDFLTEASISQLVADVLTASEALLQDLTLEQRRQLPLFLGTTDGSLVEDLLFERSRSIQAGRYASPAIFRRTLPNIILSEIALTCQLQGPGSTLVAGPASAALAVYRAITTMQLYNEPLALAAAIEPLPPADAAPRFLLMLLGMQPPHDRHPSGAKQPPICVAASLAPGAGGQAKVPIHVSGEAGIQAISDAIKATGTSKQTISATAATGLTILLQFSAA